MINFQPVAGEATKTDIVRLMAEKMREMGMGGVPVTVESLLAYTDFTRAEVEKHGGEAADLAKQLSVVQRRAA